MPSWDAEFIVIGSGLAGLSFALKSAQRGRVLIVTKATLSDTNSQMAQGGIAAVWGAKDSFDKHVEDTLVAGAGLCHRDVVEQMVRQAPERILELEAFGVRFDRKPALGEDAGQFDLTREGGHSERRILHVEDHTGESIQAVMMARVREHPNIVVHEQCFAMDLITSRQLWPNQPGPARCFGVQILDQREARSRSIFAPVTVLATGGAGKVYLYTSNWSGATGDGIAMAFRAGARVMNLEFMQFHPTCLYHPAARNFLISEALRGEGGELINRQGHRFMKTYHSLGNLAPRDIVARAIDTEMKRSGDPCVYLDMTHLKADFILKRFPLISKRCLEYGIDITKQPIPVVPAAHYLCGGVLTDLYGQTDIDGLFAIGETGANGFQGANRLASNSLLECLGSAHNAWSKACERKPFARPDADVPLHPTRSPNSEDELVVISHMWDEVRRLMWNYVGIVRSDRRLNRAEARLRTILAEVSEEARALGDHKDLFELKNLTLVAYLTVKCAQARRESRGIHFSLDHQETLAKAIDTVVAPNFEVMNTP